MLGTTLRYDYEVRDDKQFFKYIGRHRAAGLLTAIDIHPR
jgi:non-homologous end joining protein Ku